MFRSTIQRLAIAATMALALSACVVESRYDQLQSAYNQLMAAYTADQAEIVMLQGRLKVTMTDRVLFPEGGYRLQPGSEAALRKMVPTLVGLKQTQVVIEGYTDNVPIGEALRREGIATNLDLSSKRADTVADFLIRQGVPGGIVSAQGRGDSNPVASNDTPEGRARNRRIEVTLVGPGG